MTNGAVTAAAAQVLEMSLSGLTPAEIARRLGVSRQAVHFHLKKNTDVQTAKKRFQVDMVIDNWLTEKRFRLEKMQKVYDDLEAIAIERTYSVTETTAVGDDVTVTAKRIDGALMTAMRGLLSDAADELGQKPRGATIDLSDRRTYVLQVVKSGASDVELG